MNFNLFIHVKKNQTEISNYTKNSQLKRELVEKSKHVQGEIPTSNSKHYVMKVIM